MCAANRILVPLLCLLAGVAYPQARKPQLVTQSCLHNTWPTLSPDDHVLVTVDNRAACLWEVASGRLLRKLSGHTDRIRQVAFSPDGSTILTRADDVILWDAASGAILQRLSVGEARIVAASFGDNGRNVLIATPGLLAVFETSSGRELRKAPLPDPPADPFRICSGFSADGSALVLCGHQKDRPLYIWNVASLGSPLRLALTANKTDSTQAELSFDGSLLLVREIGKSYAVWDTRRARQLWAVSDTSRRATFSADGAEVLLAGDGIKAYRSIDGVELSSSQASSGQGAVDYVAVSHDTRWAAIATNSGEVEYTALDNAPSRISTDEVFDRAIVSADGGTLLASRGLAVAAAETVLFDVNSGKPVMRRKGRAIAFSPDGRLAFVGDAVIETASLRVLHQFQDVETVAFSANGKSLYLGATHGLIVATERLDDPARPFPGSYDLLAVSEDELYALLGTPGGLELREIDSGRSLGQLYHGSSSIEAASFYSGHQRAAAINDDGYLVEWELGAAGAREILRVRVHASQYENSKSLVISKDETKAVVGYYSGNLAVVDLASGEVTAELGRLNGSVLDLRRIANEDAIWCVSRKLSVSRVDMSHRTPPIAERTVDVRFISRSVDGKSLLTGWERPVRWSLETGGETARAQQNFAVTPGLRLTDPPHHMAAAADGRRILLARAGGVNQWVPADETFSQLAPNSPNVVGAMGLSEDGKFGVVVEWLEKEEQGSVIRLLNLDSGREIRALSSSFHFADCVAFSPDMKLLAVGGFGGIEVFSFDKAQRLNRVRTIPGPPETEFCGLSFSPDGTQLLAGGDPPGVYDIASGSLIHALHAEDRNDAVVFSPNGRFIVIGTNRGANLFEWPGGRLIVNLPHVENVQAVAFTSDSHYVFTGSDSTTRVWSIPGGELIASMYSFDQGDWAVVAPDGRFDTNNFDRRMPLHWVMPADPFRALPFELFMREYYTPRLLPRLLSGEHLPPVRELARLDLRQPVVRIKSITPQADPHLVTVSVEAGDGARDLRLFRDGQLVGYHEGFWTGGLVEFRDVRIPHYSQPTTVPFTAYALNKDLVRSEISSASYRLAGSEEVPPRAFVINIGVDRNRATGCDLRYAVADAIALHGVIQEGWKTLTPRMNLLVADDANPNGASKTAIRDVLARFAQDVRPEDVFLLSFSGHGYTEKSGLFYLIPSDLEGDCSHVDARLLASAISMDELRDWLRPIDAGEMVLILDACFAGASVESGDFKPGPMGSAGLGQLAYDKRMRILAASQPNQAAGETPLLGMGFLTYALVKDGIERKQADWRPKDGQIHLSEWLNFAVKRVPAIDESLRRGIGAPRALLHPDSPSQTPSLFDFTPRDNAGLRIK
jgi:WD40 repeat protein